MSVVFTIENAGDPRFNGAYIEDVEHGQENQAPTYRKVGGRPETLNRTSNRWYICTNHSGSYYYVESTAQRPPTDGWVLGSEGSHAAPPPTLRYHDASSQSTSAPS